ncbi:polysaccharide deacetylase family protein [Bdellovibrio sp. HCB274]|uniref:polysaccharide deacetylase family protein n=1 Tax=Bdellovibrio sp. HCB274 TaxID=3394361 RepID=UPI0039B5C457
MLQLFLLAIFVVFLSTPAVASQVSITVDDFNLSSEIGMEPLKRNAAILAALKKHKIKAAGFVTTKYLNDSKAVEAVKEWSSSGHVIGNHTENHWKYNDKTPAEFSADIIAAENKLKPFATFKKIFRFPYLKEGETLEKRDTLRSFLKNNGYSNGHVSIDASDWYINMRLVEKLKKGESVNLEKYKNFYLKHIWDRSEYYSKLARKTLNHDIKHTLLLHHNLTTALFLDDLLKMYQEKGWKVIDAENAFMDPTYSRSSDNIPAGESIVWALAKQMGDKSLRYPAEDSVYEKDEMDKLGL